MLYFMEEVKSVVRTVRSKLRQRESGCDYLRWDPARTNAALTGRTTGHAGPQFTLQLYFCKNNLTPEGYCRLSGAHSLFNCVP